MDAQTIGEQYRQLVAENEALLTADPDADVQPVDDAITMLARERGLSEQEVHEALDAEFGVGPGH